MDSFKTLIIFVLFIWSSSIHCQNEGNKWVIGHSVTGNPEYSVMHLDFSGPTLVIDWHFDERLIINETVDNPLILTPAFRSKLTPRPYPHFSYLLAA